MSYGCYNRAPFKPEVETVAVEPVLSLSARTGIVYRSWPHVFTTDCQYTKSNLGKADPLCVGCKWREA